MDARPACALPAVAGHAQRQAEERDLLRDRALAEGSVHLIVKAGRRLPEAVEQAVRFLAGCMPCFGGASPR